MATTYDVGDVVRLSANFQQSSADMDPTTVALTVVAPDATSVTYTYAGATITKDSVGDYHVDVSLTAAGKWKYRWVSTGTGAAAEEGFVLVRSRLVS